jgi:hypothetical protein
MTTAGQFRIWLNKHYTIYQSGWALKTQMKNKKFLTPQVYTYDDLHKHWLENVKNK